MVREKGASGHKGVKFSQERKLLVNSSVTHCTDTHRHGNILTREVGILENVWMEAEEMGSGEPCVAPVEYFRGNPYSSSFIMGYGVDLMGRLVRATATQASEISCRRATLTFQSQISHLWKRHQLPSRVKSTGELLKIEYSFFLNFACKMFDSPTVSLYSCFC